MPRKKIDPSFYENTDFGKQLAESKSKEVIKPHNKRITINISEEIFEEAHVLDKFMNMGYQNVLKAAMTLGLEQLNKTISESKRSSGKLKRVRG